MVDWWLCEPVISNNTSGLVCTVDTGSITRVYVYIDLICNTPAFEDIFVEMLTWCGGGSSAPMFNINFTYLGLHTGGMSQLKGRFYWMLFHMALYMFSGCDIKEESRDNIGTGRWYYFWDSVELKLIFLLLFCRWSTDLTKYFSPTCATIYRTNSVWRALCFVVL